MQSLLLVSQQRNTLLVLSNAVDEMMCNSVQYSVNGNIEKYPKTLVRNFELIASLIPLIHLYCSNVPYYVTWYFSALQSIAKLKEAREKAAKTSSLRI